MKKLGAFFLIVSLAFCSIGCGAGDTENGATDGPQLPPEAVPDSDTVPVAPDAMSDNGELAPDNADAGTP